MFLRLIFSTSITSLRPVNFPFKIFISGNHTGFQFIHAYNKEETSTAKREKRSPEYLPKISAHVMRHTACTRMAGQRMDVKVLQYIMGHAHISVTMEVYNHLDGLDRVEKEIARLDNMAVNS